MTKETTLTKQKTETYILANLQSLDPVTVYVHNYCSGKGKIVIECYGKAWAHYWGGMGKKSLQEFFVSCDASYIVMKLVPDLMVTDFDAIRNKAKEKGFDICASSAAELVWMHNEMSECFGADWYMDIPQTDSSESLYVSRIVKAIQEAFKKEISE